MKILGCALSIGLLSFTVMSAEPQSLNKLMEQWLTIESQKGKLQLDWNTREQQLKQTYSLLGSEKSTLESLLKKTDTEKSDVDNRRFELSEQQSLLEQEQREVKESIQQATLFSRSFIERLPPPLQKKWQEKLLLLTQSGATDSEKLERILTLYKLANEFDEQVALNRTSMEVPLANGEVQNLLVTQIYLGLSQGWYVSDDGQHYGYGRASQVQWQWWHNQDASTELGRILNAQDLLEFKYILENPTSAEFIKLPVKVLKEKDVS
ncbi:DUF3450 domain-containing protein [Colwellia sp. D2M02]|uniref:DUF3450 family protein n=1 Tax=Colwellia sp. D2M02 TaxID=2841562 RepID=UPI001C07F36A|nr:DUF3450 family protein [Colwellia sp. D2M02]MBU2893041.1 DUF3450 domain-containing protein [Colwellia sp. D2M02]